MKKTIFWLLGLISLGLIFIKPVFSWSSFTPTDIFATHQFLTKMAYDHLSKHPALEYLDFPSLDEILVYAGVSASYNFQDGLAITGEGPDNSKHSIYSSHWYNPKNGGKGDTPESARKHFDLLKEKLGMKPPSKIDPVASNKTHWPAAKDAAWLAHFIQDMTCPFHVVGMPKNEVSENKVGRSDVVGPFRTFDPRSWAVVVQRSRGDKHGKGANWFDPSYYDGLSFEPVMTGTHFLYEALVEIEYQKAILENFSTIRNALGRDYVSKGWKPSMKIEDFVKAVAKKTREKLDGKHEQLYFDSNEFQKNLVKNTAAIRSQLNPKTGGISAIIYNLYNLLDTEIKVPWEEWTRAIRATYTAWRSTFSALRIQDVQLVQVFDKKDTFKLKLTAVNYEPDETAKKVKIKYEISNDNFNDTGNFPTIENIPRFQSGSNMPGSIDLESETIYIPEITDLTVLFLIEGMYENVPDLGTNNLEFNVSVAQRQLENMPNLKNEDFEMASIILNKLFPYPNSLKITTKRGKSAPSDPMEKNMNYRIYGQKPDPGTLIGPGDEVTATYYVPHGEAEVPDVGGLTETKAIEAIEEAGFKKHEVTYLWKEETDSKDLVVDQYPKKKMLMKIEDPVHIWIHKLIAQPEEFEERDRWEVDVETDMREEEPPPEEAEDTGTVTLGALVISPGAVELSLDKRKSANFAVAAFDLNGSPVTGERLANVNFRWSVSDPSIAGIVGSGGKVSVYAIKEGVTTAICSTRSQVTAAAVTVKKIGGPGEWDENMDWEVEEGGEEEGEGERRGTGGGTTGTSGGTEDRNRRRTGGGSTSGGGTGTRRGGTEGVRRQSGAGTGNQTGLNLLDQPVLDEWDIVGLWNSSGVRYSDMTKDQFDYAMAAEVTRQGNMYVGKVLAVGPMIGRRHPAGSKIFEVKLVQDHYFQGTVFWYDYAGSKSWKKRPLYLWCNTYVDHLGQGLGLMQSQKKGSIPDWDIGWHKHPARNVITNGEVIDFYEQIRRWPKK